MKERKKSTRSVKAKTDNFEKIVKVVENKVKTHLSSDHLRQIDAVMAEVAISKAEMAAKDQTIVAIKLEAQLMQHKLVSELNKQREASNTYENAKKKAGHLINDMKKLYNVTGELEYDNDSGEIKR